MMAEKSPDVQTSKPTTPIEEQPSGNWWDSWITSAKTKSAEVYSMVKKDLDEIGSAVKSEASHVFTTTSTALGKTLKLDEPESPANVMKKSFSTFIGQVSTVLNPEPDDEDDTEVILSSGDTTMLSTYKKELEALQRVDATYLVPAYSPEFDAWRSSLELSDSEPLIAPASAAKRLAASATLRAMYQKLVPDAVSHDDFWERYLFRVALLQDRLAAAARRQPARVVDPVLAHLPLHTDPAPEPVQQSPKKVLSGIDSEVVDEPELAEPTPLADVVAWEDGQVSTVLNPEPDDEDDTEVILSSGDTTMLSTYKKELEALQRVDATYLVPAYSPEFDAWRSSLELSDSEPLIAPASAAKRLAASATLRAMYQKLVPDAVSHDDFWERYLFRVALLQDRLAAAARRQPARVVDPVLAHLPLHTDPAPEPVQQSPKKVLSGIDSEVVDEPELAEPTPLADVVAWEDGQVSTVLNPEPDDEDDTEVILSSGDTTMLSTYKKELEALQRVDATYLVPAYSPEFDAWRSSLELSDSEPLIAPASAAKRLAASATLRAMYQKLVPDAVSHDDFWERYLFRVALLQDRLAAAARRQPARVVDPVLAHLPLHTDPAPEPVQQSPKKVLSGIDSEVVDEPELAEPTPLADVVAWEDEDFANDVELTEEQQTLLLEEYEKEISSKKTKQTTTRDITNNNTNKNTTGSTNKNTTGSTNKNTTGSTNKNTTGNTKKAQTRNNNNKNGRSPKKAAKSDVCGNDLVEDYFGEKETKDDASANSDESWEKEFEIEDEK